MTKILYECKDKDDIEEIQIELDGDGGDILKGLARVANGFIEKTKLSQKEFLKLIDGGMTAVRLEDFMNKKDINEDDEKFVDDFLNELLENLK